MLFGTHQLSCIVLYPLQQHVSTQQNFTFKKPLYLDKK